MIKYLSAALLFLLSAGAAAAGPAYNWSGFYVGMNAGAGMGTGEFSDSCYFCATDSFDSGYVALGGQIGHNWQKGAAVFGVEGDWDWTNFENDGVLGGDDSDFLRREIALDWLATIRGRAGLAVENVLLFATAGIAFGHVDATGVEYCCGPDDASPTLTGYTFNNSDTRVGMVGGFGVEMPLDGAWSARADYLYLDLGAGTADGSPDDICSVQYRCTVQNTFRSQIVRLAFNYHFEP